MSNLISKLHEWHTHNHRFVAYVRACTQLEIDEQCEAIDEYAKEHSLVIAETFCDLGAPMSGLHHAFEALDTADGIVVVDLNRFVTHANDRLLDLRPILHRFCSASENKHLISIAEGINTATANGQLAAMELVQDIKDVV
jgi:DNA invertase Pin-like site-specific DNA recombinase